MPRGQRNENAPEKKPRATVTPLEKAQQEAVRAFEKLATTAEALEASKARTAELERQKAYQERLLSATVTHPDLPEGFDVEAFIAAQDEDDKKEKKDKDEQEAADVEAVVSDPAVTSPEQVVATAEPAPAPVDDDDPFAGVS